MEVIVQNPNNITIDIDQGRSGRGITDVNLVTIGADYYLQFVFTDSTTETVGPIATVVTEVLYAEVRNAEAFTIQKGQPVYLYQAQGNLATVKLASNLGDSTSAKTLGLAAENILAGAQGLVTAQGTLDSLNTSAYAEGDTLYLGATAGTLTNVKPKAPNHLVYIGVVERSNAGAGQIYVRVQNGYELDEIHDVQINSPVNGNTLIYDAATDLWKNALLTAGTSIGITNGAGSITINAAQGIGTGDSPSFTGLTLSGGTANGVLYLNGSKVATSGSALTFDGTNFISSGQIIVGNQVNANVIAKSNVANGGAGFSQFLFGNTSTDTRGFLSYSHAAEAILFGTSSSEQMRLTSTGLGIGTSSPGAKLDVRGTDNSDSVRLSLANNTNGAYQGILFTAGVYSKAAIRAYSTGTTDAGSLTFWTSPAGDIPNLRATLDSSGNLGLGVTPSAWGTSAFQTKVASVWGFSNNAYVGCNYYFDGTDRRYIATAAATEYAQFNGQHTWYTAPSGTAGNAISFTQTMTLTAAGELGLGVTSPARTFQINASSPGIRIQETASGGDKRLELFVSGSDGVIAANQSAQALAFQTIGTERARITSGGDFYVGQAGAQASERLGVTTTGATQAAGFRNNDASKDTIFIWSDTTSGTNQFVGFYTDTLQPRGSITYNRAGGLVAYNTTSDYRAKDIIGPITNPGATIDALKVYEGQMKGATQSRPMLVAHEAQAVAPYSVTGEKDAVNEDGTPKFQQMDVSSLVPLLLAEIQSLRARVAALESN